MQEQPVRRLPVGIIAGVSAAVLAAVGGAWWASNSNQSSTLPQTATTSQPQPTQQAVNPATKSVQIYWLKSAGNKIELVPTSIKVQGSDKPATLLEGAFTQLLAGPTDKQVTSTIPTQTKLRGVEVREDGVHVDLSKEFTTGGGSTSMSGRLAQVLYTATSLNPDAKVWINVEGQKLDVLGGEGIVVDQPMTRKNFEENFAL